MITFNNSKKTLPSNLLPRETAGEQKAFGESYGQNKSVLKPFKSLAYS